MAADLAATARLVWDTNGGLFAIILCLSVVLALVPAATLWVSKLLLDAVALAVRGGFPTPQEAYRQLALLLGLQVAIGATAALLQTVYGASRELLGDTLQNRISRRILEKAAALDVESFENAETYDALRNAYNEVGSRPLGVMFQMIGIGQALITLGSIGSLMSRLGWHVMPIVLLASIPGVIVSSKFGAEGYRMIRRRATEARHQNYLGSLLTSDTLVKEVRLFGFEQYLLEDVLPVIEKQYRVTPGRENRAIAGLSMGGGQAVQIGLSHLNLFSALGVFSGAVPGDFSTRFKSLLEDPAGTNAKLKLIWIGCGKQDSLFSRSQQMADTLEAHKINHVFAPSEGLHNYANWRLYLCEMVPLLFRDGK